MTRLTDPEPVDMTKRRAWQLLDDAARAGEELPEQAATYVLEHLCLCDDRRLPCPLHDEEEPPEDTWLLEQLERRLNLTLVTP